MKIAVVGGGLIGTTVISQLSHEGYDVVVIERDEQRLKYITDRYDVMGVLGSGANLSVLKDAEVGKADLLVALTNQDELNILCCMSAKKLGASAAVARVRNPEYIGQMSFLKRELGLSFSINPEYDCMAEIARVLKFPYALSIETFANNRAELIEMKVEKNSKLDGVSLMDLNRKRQKVLVCAVQRGEETVIPHGNFVLRAGDRIHMTATAPILREFVKEYDIPTPRLKRVVILGGGVDAYYLAKQLIEANLQVKIVVNDFERAETLTLMLPKAGVIYGDPADTDLLTEEHIGDADAAVCLTGSDETNSILSFFAKRKGVNKVIARVDKGSIKNLLDAVDLDTVISPRTVAANRIVQFVRAMNNASGNGVRSVYQLMDGRIEALEFAADRDSHLGIPLKDLKIKKNTLIGCIIRGSEFIRPSGDTTVEEGDSVIVVTQNEKSFDSLSDIWEDA